MTEPAKLRHGDAERIYDQMVLWGLDPVPWQYEFLNRIEQHSLDKQFREIVAQTERPTT